MSDLKRKRVITAALTGSWPTHDDNPNVPFTPKEIADQAYECWKAGAAMAKAQRTAYPSPPMV